MSSAWMDSVRSVGHGEHQVVCLHGWFGSGQGWGFLPEVVDGERFTYHFPDMRGYGERMAEDGEFTMREYAADVAELVRARGWDRFSVVGHSMGGKAAAALLARLPEGVRCVVGISAVGPGPVPLDDDGHDLFFGAPEDDAKRRGIIDFTTGGRHSGAWLDAMVRDNRATSSQPAFTGAVRSWVEDDYTAEFGRPETPVLLITGEHDPALSAETMRQTWVPLCADASVVELAGCGHYPMHEVPVTLATEMETFLGRH